MDYIYTLYIGTYIHIHTSDLQYCLTLTAESTMQGDSLLLGSTQGHLDTQLGRVRGWTSNLTGQPALPPELLGGLLHPHFSLLSPFQGVVRKLPLRLLIRLSLLWGIKNSFTPYENIQSQFIDLEKSWIMGPLMPMIIFPCCPGIRPGILTQQFQDPIVR